MNDFYIYNNEALSSLILLSSLKEIESIRLEKFILILPIALDNRIVKVIADSEHKNLGSFIKENSSLFVRFNIRFNNILPITINCFHILNTLGYIELQNYRIFISESLPERIKLDSERFENIEKIIKKLIELLINTESDELYTLLNIKL